MVSLFLTFLQAFTVSICSTVVSKLSLRSIIKSDRPGGHIICLFSPFVHSFILSRRSTCYLSAAMMDAAGSLYAAGILEWCKILHQSAWFRHHMIASLQHKMWKTAAFVKLLEFQRNCQGSFIWDTRRVCMDMVCYDESFWDSHCAPKKQVSWPRHWHQSLFQARWHWLTVMPQSCLHCLVNNCNCISCLPNLLDHQEKTLTTRKNSTVFPLS